MSVRVPVIPVWMTESGNLLCKLLQRGKDLLFPRRCPVCDEVVPWKEGLICSGCRPKIRYVGEHYCMKCGKPLEKQETEFCGDCSARSHVFDRGRSVFLYPSVAGSIYRFKYGGRREYAGFYAAEIRRQLGESIRYWQPDALVPVPIHWKRRAVRGYNQAEELAKKLSQITRIPMRKNLIRRCRNTVPQKLLNLRQRQNNLKKAFNICQDDVKLDTIILIDDIYTTGSTVDAMASLLKAAGVEKVYVISLAIGRG